MLFFKNREIHPSIWHPDWLLKETSLVYNSLSNCCQRERDFFYFRMRITRPCSDYKYFFCTPPVIIDWGLCGSGGSPATSRIRNWDKHYQTNKSPGTIDYFHGILRGKEEEEDKKQEKESESQMFCSVESISGHLVSSWPCLCPCPLPIYHSIQPWINIHLIIRWSPCGWQEKQKQ